ncbi:AAA family ATPase [Streptomyces sp. NPDC005820]|uniref:helix-turn-helix transcriptional regulator n=1 Tax=Streptomyces sp. NPDC005820 TaxID=3157069 RepID=UPI0034066C4A
MPETDGTAIRLVGRAGELARLDEVIAGLGRADVPAVVDISGDAGLGKSRLLGEVCARARRAGLVVLRGTATEFERYTPFQVFTDAFADADPAFLASGGVPEAAGAVVFGVGAGAAGVAGSAGMRGGDRFGRYRAVAEVLGALAGRHGGVMVALDDLHWADPASLELLDQLIRHPVGGRVVLVVARRERQTPYAPAAALARGVDRGAVLGVRLGPLPEREWIEALAADLPLEEARGLYAAGEGNPLYLRCLLDARRQGGAVPAAREVAVSGVPEGLAALLLEEVGALSTVERGVVEAVAVLGDHATSGLLRAVSADSSAEELDAGTGAAVRRDLLRMGADGRWVLRHPLVRALVYENIPALRRAALHRAVAEELTRRGAGAAERAHHVERSLTGWDPVAAEVLTEAAAQCAPTAPATAAHLLEVVLRLMPDTPAHAGRRGELTLARARALAVGGSLRESRDLLHTLISGCGPHEAVLRGDATALCALMERYLGHSPEASALLRRELTRDPGPGPRQAVSLGLALGTAALNTVSYPAVRDDIQRTLALARSHHDPMGELGALALAALGEAYEGETATATRSADSAAALADGLTDPDLTELSEALVWLAWAEALLERYADAERHTDRALDLARRAGQVHVLPHLLTARAFVHLTTCRLPTALAAAEEAETVARAVAGGDLLAFTLSFKALILLLHRPLGDTQALCTAEEAVAAAGPSRHWWASLAGCVLGHTALVSGDPHRAQDAILRAGGPELLGLQPSTRPGQLDTLVATALATGDPDQAERWAAQATAEADRIDLDGQRAAALRARAALAQHHGDPHTAARLLQDAARAYAPSGAGLWQAYSLLLASTQAQATGDHPRAVALWEHAQRLAETGGARLLTDLAALVRPRTEEPPPAPTELDQLTARERQIAELVAEGLGNQAIATKLFLSRRTVETHLSAIYRKTSVPSRSALAGLMTRATLDRSP